MCALSSGCAPREHGRLATPSNPDPDLSQPNQLTEEACITALDMEEAGRLTFVFDDNPQPWSVHGGPGMRASLLLPSGGREKATQCTQFASPTLLLAASTRSVPSDEV